MIVVLSPSKSMQLDPVPGHACSQPAFLAKSTQLVTALRRLSQDELMQFMAISPALAQLNQQRFREWQTPFTPATAKQALFTFTGAVYDGLDALSLKPREEEFAQQHLRILSGLYGWLKPLDLIQPYRLEMGRPLAMGETKDLYGFWRSTITEALNQEEGELLVNLASQEYAKAIDLKTLNKSVISPVFKDEKNGTLKIISVYAKKARGSMARFIIHNRVTDAAGLLAFTGLGYAYAPDLSKPDSPVFTRYETAPKRPR